MPTDQTPAPPPADIPVITRDRELDVFAFVLLIVRHLRFIVGCGIVAFLLQLVNMLHTKPRFAATAVMIIPQGNITSSTIAAQLSATTADLLGGGFELYADILRSRTVGEHIVRDFDLMKVYGVPNEELAVASLSAVTKIETQREGVVRVTVQDGSAQRAADIANDYLHQLDQLNSSLVLSSIGAERAYLEREMIKEKNALADAEVSLKGVQESTSGLAPDAVASAGLNALVTTRATLRADQIRLAALLTGATESNPEVMRLRSEINGLSGQLQQLERGSSSSANGTPTSQVPAQTLEYTRRLREVKFHETLFDLLEKQFAGAKEQEAKTPSIVQVLDPAIPAQHKAWPPRAYYCVVAAIVGTVVGLLLVLLRAFGSVYLRAPQNQQQLASLRAVVRSWFPGKARA